jgi:hypothetical protein
MTTPVKDKPPTLVKPPTTIPPKSNEELEADAAFDAACEDVKLEAKKLHASATSLKRTVSDSKMQAVRLPTPSQIEMEAQPSKR